jgi:thiol-disulfide isomerase/thioredoxin
VKAWLLPILKQLLIFIAVVVVIGQWQSRHLPSGEAPVSGVRTIAGDSQSLPIKGQATLIYFFAPWCGVCKLSMPNLNTIQRLFPTLSINAVALDFESEEDVRKFSEDLGLRVPILLGGEDLRKSWQIDAYPTYMIIDSSGKIRASAIGYSSQLGMILRVTWTKIFS